MNDAQADEMLNLLREMNHKLGKLDDLESSLGEMRSDIARLDNKIERVFDSYGKTQYNVGPRERD